VGERFLDTEEVGGSIPPVPTSAGQTLPPVIFGRALSPRSFVTLQSLPLIDGVLASLQ
jgi:hypothetical protein